MSGFRHDFDPTSLREYDIRGMVGKTLHPRRRLRHRPGVRQHRRGEQAAAPWRSAIDGRLSSPDLEPPLVDGLKASGMEVSRIGLRPDADAVLRRHHPDDRRRDHGHRQPQPAGL